MSATALPISIRLVLPRTATSSGNGEASSRANDGPGNRPHPRPDWACVHPANLVQHHLIAPAHGTRGQHRGVDAEAGEGSRSEHRKFDLIELIHGGNSVATVWQPSMREHRHRAARRGSDHFDFDGIADADAAADPLVFGK